MNRFLENYGAGWGMTFRLLGVAIILNCYAAPFLIVYELLPDNSLGLYFGVSLWLTYLLLLPLAVLFTMRLVGLRQTTPVEREDAHQKVIDQKNRELEEEARRS